MKKINLAIGIHNHQPVGNFDFVFEEAYQKAYLPFLEVVEKYPRIPIALHYTGILLQWITEHRPEFILRLKKLVAAAQVEMMTGGFYEPILSVIPDRDKIGQIEKLTDFVTEQTGYIPKGMWLAERIWEPHLPKPCAEAGVQYLVLDDSHFKSAGLHEKEMFGYFITEEEGRTVYLFPISEKLRYTIPFQSPENTIDYLHSIAEENKEALVVFADDGEKFGIWPGTYEHCYQNGWLEDFFQILESNSDWINVLCFSDALKKMKPLSEIFLPAASYREMMEWAMPTKAIYDYQGFEAKLQKADLLEKNKVFVRGGFWRNFMVKYPESNNMHKKMLYLSERLNALTRHSHTDDFKTSQNHLWAGQCNCPYWHGVFGGLYLNHLRYATYHELIQAEQILDTLEHDLKDRKNGWLDYKKIDFDKDGSDELLISNPVVNLYFSPQNGGSLFELDYKPKAINILDTMTRKEEAYHKRLWESADNKNTQCSQKQGAIQSIHDLVIMKEEGLEKQLFYDWYRRTSFLDHFLREGTTLTDFAQCKYVEVGDFINTPFEFSFDETKQGLTVRLWRNGHVWVGESWAPVYLEKKFLVEKSSSEVEVEYCVKNLDEFERSFIFGIEVDFALLAGDAPDRFYVFPENEISDSKLRSTGEVSSACEAKLVDNWLGISIALKVDEPATFWRFPIETISQSESGFERVYQSSVVFPKWSFSLASGESLTRKLSLIIAEL